MAANEWAFGLIFAALDPALLVPTLTFIGALLIGAVVVAFVRRWQQTQRRLSPTASDQLAEFRSLYEQGRMTEEEFKRVRAKLTAELRKAIDVPAPPAAAASPPQPPPADPNAIQPAGDNPPPGDQPPPETGIRPA